MIPFTSQCWNRQNQADCVFAWSCKIEAVSKDDWIEENVVSRRLKARGFQATPEQLARWRGAGLLPTADQPGLGRGKGRAAATFHPVTIPQAARVKQLLEEGFNFEQIGWRLWTEGFMVDIKYWEPILRRAHGQWLQLNNLMLQSSVDDDDEASEKLELAIQTIFQLKKTHLAVKAIRMSLNSKRFLSFGFMIINTAVSQFEIHLEKKDKDYIEDDKILNLVFSNNDLKKKSDRIFPEDLSAILKFISKSMYFCENCFEISQENGHVHGRKYLISFREIIEETKKQLIFVPKLFFRVLLNHKSPEVDAILIASLPIILPHLSHQGQVQPEMQRVIELISATTGIIQTEDGPKWLIPNME